MSRPVTVQLDERHFEALQQLAARLHMEPEEVLRESLRVRNSIWRHQMPMPVEPYADLPAMPEQERATIVGESTPFSSKEDYYTFQRVRVFNWIRQEVVRLDPPAAHWIDKLEERLLIPGFRAQLMPEWWDLRISLDRELTIIGDQLAARGCPLGFARLMRPYTDPRVMPWITESGKCIARFVSAYICGHLPGQQIRTPDTAMAAMIRDLWAQSLEAVKFPR